MPPPRDRDKRGLSTTRCFVRRGSTSLGTLSLSKGRSERPVEGRRTQYGNLPTLSSLSGALSATADRAERRIWSEGIQNAVPNKK